jgi:hypothetical protein
MTDDQETRWWQAVDDGCRFLVHGLMVTLTWPVWLLGKMVRRKRTNPLPQAPRLTSQGEG